MKRSELFTLEGRIPLFWRLQAVGFAGLGIVSLGVLWGIGLPWWSFLTVSLPALLAGGLLTTFLLRPVLRRVQGTDCPWVLLVPCLALVSLALAMLTGEGLRWLAERAFGESIVQRIAFLHSDFPRAVLFFGWSVLYLGIRDVIAVHRRSLQLLEERAANREAELRILRAQMDSHFLFNALSSFQALADEPTKVRSLSQGLGTFLHNALDRKGVRGPLREELEALRAYLVIEQLRFGEELVFAVSIDRAAGGLSVLRGMVQPLLENALKHGWRSGPRVLRIGISARLWDDFLEIAVTNTGRWIPPRPDCPGKGLALLRRRLQLAYGSGPSLSQSEEGSEVRSVLRLPLSLLGDPAEEPDPLRAGWSGAKATGSPSEVVPVDRE